MSWIKFSHYPMLLCHPEPFWLLCHIILQLLTLCCQVSSMLAVIMALWSGITAFCCLALQSGKDNSVRGSPNTIFSVCQHCFTRTLEFCHLGLWQMEWLANFPTMPRFYRSRVFKYCLRKLIRVPKWGQVCFLLTFHNSFKTNCTVGSTQAFFPQ